MYKAQIGMILDLTLITLGVTGCYNNQRATQTQESRLKTEFSEQEQQNLSNNMIAIHTAKNMAASAQVSQDFKFIKDGYFTVAVGTKSFASLHVLVEDNQIGVGSEIDIASGEYLQDLSGWNLQDESIPQSVLIH